MDWDAKAWHFHGHQQKDLSVVSCLKNVIEWMEKVLIRWNWRKSWGKVCKQLFSTCDSTRFFISLSKCFKKDKKVFHDVKLVKKKSFFTALNVKLRINNVEENSCINFPTHKLYNNIDICVMSFRISMNSKSRIFTSFMIHAEKL